MDQSFERALLQKLYSLEKLSLRLLDKMQKTETENLKLLGEIHSRINELERSAVAKCGEYREKLQEKIDSLRELLYASEGDASKTRESFSMGLSNKFKDVYGCIDEAEKEIGKLSTSNKLLDQKLKDHLEAEKSKFGKYATIISLLISLLAFSGMLIFGILQATSK